MASLIEITTVPIQIEMKVTNAKLEYLNGSAELEISRNDNNNVSIKSRSIRVNMDTFEARNDISRAFTGSRHPQHQSVQSDGQNVYDASVLYSPQELLLKTHISGDYSAVESMNNMKNTKNTTADVSQMDSSEMNIRYEMDKLSMNWKINSLGFEFTPGDIEFTVTQRPDVIIKYIGGPMYVPPSADPNYVPVDVKA